MYSIARVEGSMFCRSLAPAGLRPQHTAVLLTPVGLEKVFSRGQLYNLLYPHGVVQVLLLRKRLKKNGCYNSEVTPKSWTFEKAPSSTESTFTRSLNICSYHSGGSPKQTASLFLTTE